MVSNVFLLLNPDLGQMMQTWHLDIFFNRGWFNHQPDLVKKLRRTWELFASMSFPRAFGMRLVASLDLPWRALEGPYFPSPWRRAASPDPWIFVEGFGGVFNVHETLKALSCGGSTKKNSSDIGFLYGYHHLQNHMFWWSLFSKRKKWSRVVANLRIHGVPMIFSLNSLGENMRIFTTRGSSNLDGNLSGWLVQISIQHESVDVGG